MKQNENNEYSTGMLIRRFLPYFKPYRRTLYADLFCAAVMGAKIETDMRRDAYAHLQLLSNTYFNNTKVGQIMGRITNDLFEVTEFAHHCPEEFLIAADIANLCVCADYDFCV